MKTYELSEFSFLLKLGLWTGGEVIGLGYVSSANKVSSNENTAGLSGIELSSGVRLEKQEMTGMSDMDLIFSVYEPYRGTYLFWSVSTNYTSNLEEVLFASAQQNENIKRKSTGRTYTSFRNKSKYIDHRTIMTRSGKINI
ncbi:hypothetical protein [Bacteroides sp. 224]|uniref:hypothetical protein n=1 Tax=Bacteroides sp. 224 TaxID=2302936 RepID=UPI0013D1B1F7|nr:DUF5456 family protein [Bacteroides sp. 224]NDV64651.1 hypothetical protein [Bacteroides sp. 224]